MCAFMCVCVFARVCVCMILLFAELDNSILTHTCNTLNIHAHIYTSYKFPDH